MQKPPRVGKHVSLNQGAGVLYDPSEALIIKQHWQGPPADFPPLRSCLSSQPGPCLAGSLLASSLSFCFLCFQLIASECPAASWRLCNFGLPATAPSRPGHRPEKGEQDRLLHPLKCNPGRLGFLTPGLDLKAPPVGPGSFICDVNQGMSKR